MGEEVLLAELHRTVMEDNVMKMVKVDKVCVEPFSTVKMRGAEGEGYHVMVFGELEHFDSFHVHLKMESGKVIHFYAQPTGAGSQHTH
jgi:copper(I)-binding protein